MRDVRFENWLTGQGVEFVYEATLPIEKINMAASLKNQARLGPDSLDKARVDLMIEALNNGVELPAVIAYDTKKGYVLVDGNHRTDASIQAGKKTMDVYRLTNVTDPYIIDRLTRTANTVEGKGLSDAERLAHGVYLCQKYGRTIVEVATALNVSKHALEARLLAAKMDQRLAGRNIDVGKLTQTQKQTAYRIQNDHALDAAVKLLDEAKLPASQFDELCKIVRNERTESGQIAAIQAFAKRPEIEIRFQESLRGKACPPGLQPGVQAMKAIRNAYNVFTRFGLDEHLPTIADGELKRIQDEWMRTKNAVEKVLYGQPKITRG